ncbi:histidine--tRNA ligase [Candidatus Nomurabacteria bacterium]|nr:histidine--tRNA ligase [Candidatus Nomurabacteria bacterium]
MSKVSTENYKGVRDFYPEDQSVQNYIFFIWKETMESFGYEQYDASILEYSDLYKAKSGQEIVTEQTYNFVDRGERDVTLRPEMTPTIARMIARKKRDLVFPLRWYSIPNLFRYERPQKGRLREHWQLNGDIFSINNIFAELEVIEIASTILRNFGLNDIQFEIRINDRKILNKKFEELGLNEIQSSELSRLIDKKDKIDDFDEQVEKLLGKKIRLDFEPNEEITAIIDKLKRRGISNVVFSPTITRGMDYYTGFVFEVYDTNPENNRALMGGGRYDDLLNIFNEEKLPAVGFGMGDVMLRETLETYGLIPKHYNQTDLAFCPLNEAFFDIVSEWATELREAGLNVTIDYSGKKIKDQISKADKRGIQFISCIGDEEISSKKLIIKNLQTSKETKLPLSKVAQFVKNNRSV